MSAALSGLLALQVSADATQQLTFTPPTRVRIEAGFFTMGSSERDVAQATALCTQSAPAGTRCDAGAFADESPAHEVYLGSFSIDRTEVANAAYRRCVAAGACLPSGVSDRDPEKGQPNQPVVEITWSDAARYCAWVGGRLPTEAQWERVARGESERAFPWGADWNPRLSNHAQAVGEASPLDGYLQAAPVDAYPDGRSACGLRNLAGNVWELVADRYGPYASAGSAVDPEGPRIGTERVLRGGSWRGAPPFLRVRARAHLAEAERRPDVGFRCAYPSELVTPARAPKP